jgi:hypothetical protein
MATNFYNISRAVIADAQKKPGHSDVMRLCPASWITTWASTLNDGTPGSKKRIPGNHTFAAGKNPLEVIMKPKSVEPTGDAQGEVGGQVQNYKYKCIIKGDSATIQEFVEDILNEDLVAWFNDPTCGVDAFTQVGGECTPAQISGWAFRGGSKGNGGFKEYEFTIESADKFFYEGALADYVDPDLQLATPSEPIVSGLAATTATVTWGDVPNAVSYEIQRSTSPAFTAPVSETIADPTVAKAYTGLVTATTYYFRVRAVAAGYVTSEYAVTAFTTA